MKAMVSQPMGGKSEEEIAQVQVKALKCLTEKGYSVLDTNFTDDWFNEQTSGSSDFVIHRPLYFLAKSLEAMAYCSAVYFCKGWKDYRGCRLEHDAAVAYGLDIIYEE